MNFGVCLFWGVGLDWGLGPGRTISLIIITRLHDCCQLYAIYAILVANSHRWEVNLK